MITLSIASMARKITMSVSVGFFCDNVSIASMACKITMSVSKFCFGCDNVSLASVAQKITMSVLMGFWFLL